MNHSQGAASMSTSSSQIHRSWKVALAVAIVMVVLAVVGVGLTTSDRAIASTYWMALVPVYGLLCVAVAWVRANRGEGGVGVVARQVLHWLGIAAAVWLDFFIRRAGEETGVAAGFTALLLLALGCFLAGVHFERLFAVVGLLLTATLLAVVRADQFLWPIVIVSVIGFAVLIWVMRRGARADRRESHAGQSTPVGS
jgi:hypothetical protein